MTHWTGRICFGTLLALTICSAAVESVGQPAHARHRTHRYAAVRHRAHWPAYPTYGGTSDPTPSCYGPDGTPYDPDIIGGPNHVGDGGPAVNLGGYDPCAY